MTFYSLDNTTAQSELHGHLKALSDSDLYDHLEGGFFDKNRTVDGKFDHTKSLSNNAYVIDILLAASGMFMDTDFSVPTINSLQWLINNLQSPEGFFFLEMEDENTLSNYYLLSHQKIQQQLDCGDSNHDSYGVFMSAYNLRSNSFNNTQSLQLHKNTQQISKQTGHHIKHIPLLLESAHQQLIALRKERLSPPINVEFNLKANAKIISSLYIAATLFNRDDFALAADRALGNINSTHLIDYQWLIHALLKCLSYQWSDDRYQLLLRLTKEMIQDPRFIDSILSAGHSESIVNDLNVVYILSSQPALINAAQLLHKQLIARFKESKPIDANLLLTLAATTKEPKVVIIRGQNFQVTHWQQQLSSGFKPQQFIFPVGNKFAGPDPKKFPISPSVIAYNPSLDSTILQIETVDELLSCCP
ncbi:MAG: hypothetical protein ACI9N9_001942 [Enterobacterales bacterium]|jgi:uncharacterized protein YyaL (SSP411 family)